VDLCRRGSGSSYGPLAGKDEGESHTCEAVSSVTRIDKIGTGMFVCDGALVGGGLELSRLEAWLFYFGHLLLGAGSSTKVSEQKRIAKQNSLVTSEE